MSSSGSGDEVTAPANVSTNGDSCLWYAGESCQRSRSCYDCLNVGVIGDSCAVGEYGQCVSTAALDQGQTYYWASTQTYCESSDAVCTVCRYNWLEQYAKSDDVSSPVCTGEDGCICLAVCEKETRDATVIQNQCPTYEKAKVGSILLVLAAGVASFIMFSVFTYFLKRLFVFASPYVDRSGASHTRARRQRSPRGPQLSLPGWKSMREKLIETEQGNGAPSAGPSGVMRIQLSTTEATAAIVEEGEGFRPASPSEYQRYQHPQQRQEAALAMLR